MIDSLQPFRYVIWILRVEGLWPEEKNQKRYNFLSFVFNLFFTIIFIPLEIFYVTQSTNLTETVQNLYISLSEIMTGVKFINFYLRNNKLKKILKEMKENFIIKTFEEDDIVRKNIKFTDRVFVVYCIVVGSVMASAAFVPLVTGLKTLPFPVWLPFDWGSSKFKYWIAYFYDITAVTCHAYMHIANDAFIMCCSANVASQLEIIGLRFKNLKYDKRNNEDLKALMSQYNCIVDLSDLFENVFSVPNFLQFHVSSIVLCLTAFQLTVTSPLDDFSTFMVGVSYLFAMLFELLLPCFFGNEIIIKSDALSYCLFSSDWTDQTLQYKKKLIIFTERLRRPIKITAGNIILLSISTFTSVLRSSYSLFAVLQKMNQ